MGESDFDVETFIEEFEEICGLAKNSKGMSYMEMVRTLGGCLKGSRKQAYKVELKAARHDGRRKEHPDAVYISSVERLQDFKEGLLEKQQRLSGEWKILTRGKKSALEFLPVFEALASEMELSGMGQSDRDLLLGCLALIPPARPWRRCPQGSPHVPDS